MRKVWLLLFFVVLAVAVPASAWELDEFVIYLWGVPEIDDLDAKAKTLADAGLTVVNWEADKLDILGKYGLKGMVHHATPELARSLRNNPDLWGYHLGDEPYPESKFLPIAKQFREFEKADPNHPAFVNVLSTTGHFLRDWMRVTRPVILSYDYYQWWWGSDRYFEKLEQFREQSILYDVPLGSCLETNTAPESGHNSYVPTNAARMRQSVYTNLAYGVKIIEWFSSGPMFEPKSLKLSKSGQDVAEINKVLKVMGPELVNLRSVDVYHTPPLPLGTSEAPKEHWIRLIGENNRDGLVYGMFRDDDSDYDYVLIANRDYQHSQNVTMRLQSKWLGIAPWHKKKGYSYKIEQLNKTTGEWETASSSSFVGYTFFIEAAEGELFRFTTTITDPGE